MKRRISLRWLLAIAVLLALIGTLVALDRRPNPILVVEIGGRGSRGEVVVEVARTRPIRMKVRDMPLLDKNGRSLGTMPVADEVSRAAEEKELRAALDAWVAVPGRGLKVEQAWTGDDVFSTPLFTSQRCRVVLQARLVPVGGD